MVPLVYRAGNTIALDAADHVPMVAGVPALLGIALANLIENAVRHTPRGTAITVTVQHDGSIVVDDDGPGMAREDREHHGPRFRRRDTARSDSAGLGLAIVERIMSVLGGTLDVEQEGKRGARVRLLLASIPAEP